MPVYQVRLTRRVMVRESAVEEMEASSAAEAEELVAGMLDDGEIEWAAVSRDEGDPEIIATELVEEAP